MSDNHRPMNMDVTRPPFETKDRSDARAVASENGSCCHLEMIRRGCTDIARGNRRQGRGYDLGEGIHGSDGGGIGIILCGFEAPVGTVLMKHDIDRRQNDDQPYDDRSRRLHPVHGPSPAGRLSIQATGSHPIPASENPTGQANGTWRARIKDGLLTLDD